jgi:hypothetical protein
MNIHPAVIGGIFSVFFFLASIAWVQLNLRIKKVEDWKVDKGHCKVKEQLAVEKFHGIERRIQDIRDSNTTDHGELKIAIREVQHEAKRSGEELSEINKCLALLSERIPCDGGKQ